MFFLLPGTCYFPGSGITMETEINQLFQNGKTGPPTNGIMHELSASSTKQVGFERGKKRDGNHNLGRHASKARLLFVLLAC